MIEQKVPPVPALLFWEIGGIFFTCIGEVLFLKIDANMDEVDLRIWQ
jgi:hypothetical protein